MKRHKILFISSWFPNRLEPFNGNFVQRHAQAVALEHEVEILHVMGDEQITQTEICDETEQGLRTLRLYYPKSKWAFINMFKRFNAYLKGFKLMQKPDIVHANVLYNNLFFAVYLKFFEQIPFVLTEHWTAYLKNAPDAHGKIWRFFAKFIANQAHIICPVSDALADGLRHLGLKRPMQVVPNIINLDLFNLDDLQPPETFTFLHISSLCERKNPLKIIDAAVALHQINPNFLLHIGGNGPLAPLQQHIKFHQAEKYIHVFGALSIAQVAQKIKQSSAFILFSDNETQGCVLMEAMACGLPVISSQVGGTGQFIKPDFGILVPKDDVSALSQAMQKLLNSDFELAEAQNMHQFAQENYGQQAIAQAFSRIYNQVLNA